MMRFISLFADIQEYVEGAERWKNWSKAERWGFVNRV